MQQRSTQTIILPAALAATVLFSSFRLVAADWPHWRGPRMNGFSPETGLPAVWSRSENVRWRAALPGGGQSTPIVVGDRVFLTAIEAETRTLWAICLSRLNGEVLWKQAVGTGEVVRMGNSSASPSPVVGGGRVHFLFGTGILVTFDLDGNLLWRRDLVEDHGDFRIMWKYGASPLLFGDKLYVSLIHQYSAVRPRPDGPVPASYLLCIDPRSGKDLWKHERRTDALSESTEAYTTPYPFAGPDGTVIVLAGADYITAHDPTSGTEVWRSPDYNRRKEKHFRLVPSPVGVDNLIVGCIPRGRGLFALEAGGRGQLASSALAWERRQSAPDVCSPLIMDGRLYVLDGRRKRMSCLDPMTGRVYWEGRFETKPIFQASPTGADGRIYCLDLSGTVHVLRAGAEFEILSRIPMGGQGCRATIAIARGELFIRTSETLYCIGSGGTK